LNNSGGLGNRLVYRADRGLALAQRAPIRPNSI